MVSGFKIYLKSCQLPSLLVTNKKKSLWTHLGLTAGQMQCLASK